MIRVGIIELRLGFELAEFKYVFGQMFIRASVLDRKRLDESKTINERINQQ